MRAVLTLGCVAALLAACQPAAQEPAAPAAEVAVGATPATFSPGSMPLDPIDTSATLTSLTGVNTTTAAMTGRVTQADAEEYCTRDPNQEAAHTSLAQCIATTVESSGEHTASADCVAGTFDSSDWGQYRLTGTENREGSSQLYPVFMSSEGGQALGNAGGEYPVTAMFEILCPTRSAAWKAS